MTRISKTIVILTALACTGMIQCIIGGDGVETKTLYANCLKFATGETSNMCGDDFDVIGEPWCAGKGGLCGNFVKTNALTLDGIDIPPATGYISDLAGWMDCDEVDVGDILVFKLADMTYAKVRVAAVTFDTSDCADSITLEYVYPM